MSIFHITSDGKKSIKGKDPSAKIRRGWSFPCPICNDMGLPSTKKPIITMDAISSFPSRGYMGPRFIDGTCKTCGIILRVKEDAA